tara:strand:+ start:561 stop:908 length:348 start_codon:yes stop_codon:yes gene_type:complete
MVGFFSLIIDFGFYLICVEILILSESLSKIISFILASFNSYLGNKIYTFRINKFNSNEPMKFFIVYTLSLIINSNVHDFLMIKYHGLIPFSLATIISVIINFIGLKYWVFKISKN